MALIHLRSDNPTNMVRFEVTRRNWGLSRLDRATPDLILIMPVYPLTVLQTVDTVVVILIPLIGLDIRTGDCWEERNHEGGFYISWSEFFVSLSRLTGQFMLTILMCTSGLRGIVDTMASLAANSNAEPLFFRFPVKAVHHDVYGGAATHDVGGNPQVCSRWVE